ncbi:MAG: 30S ribosomal protein S19 [Patescibacteria group bacterium]
MGRSLKKGPYVDQNIQKKISKMKPGSGVAIKTWSRSSEISPEMVGYNFAVHDGKNFVEVKITEEMVGHRLGEFAPTRKFVRHGGKIQKELESKAASAAAPAAPEKK